jgi:hypothetical protein
MSEHNPTRPSWQCAGCDAPWPCATRRQQLIAEFDRSYAALCIYMANKFVDAASELPGSSAGDLYERFMRWARDAGRNAINATASR